MKINPYLAFDGRCREAFEFYEKTLGGRSPLSRRMANRPRRRAYRPKHMAGSCT